MIQKKNPFTIRLGLKSLLWHSAHHDKFSFIDNGAGSISTILKVKPGIITCGEQ